MTVCHITILLKLQIQCDVCYHRNDVLSDVLSDILGGYVSDPPGVSLDDFTTFK